MKSKLAVKGIFGSGMVLQRNKINCVYGVADGYTDVMMTFRGVTSITQSDEFGNWKLEFSPGEAGGPFEMVIKAAGERLDYSDVFVGEVWVSSGQSNAQLPMERMRFSYPEEFALPENPRIRMLTVPIRWALDGEKDCLDDSSGAKWLAASPENLGGMSGTAYFFAKRLSEELDVPVGIINASQGGSPIASWLSKSALEEMGDKREYLEQLEEFENPENVLKKQREVAEAQKSWDFDLNRHCVFPDTDSDDGWISCKIPGYIDALDSAGVVYLKKDVILSAEQAAHFNSQKTWLWLGTIVDADTAYVNGSQVGSTPYCYPPRRYEVPKGLLREGRNVIILKIQKNSKQGRIRFYEEKPYCLFTEGVFVAPTAVRNVENHAEGLFPLDGEYIALDGEWKLLVERKIRDCPSQVFFEWMPTALYNGMLAPCFMHAVAGVLWYQGESDAGHAQEYKAMLVKLINLWRHKFVYGAKDLPFVIVQLPNWSDGHGEDVAMVSSGWADTRQAQFDAAEIAGRSGLAVTIDAGEWNDLHPEKKKTVGNRSAMEALRVAYGKTFISAAPRADSCEQKDGAILIHFDCGNSGLAAYRITEKDSADFSKPGTAVHGFSLLYESDGKLTAVETQGILKDSATVEVVLKPSAGTLKEVRYLWADSPNPVNLYSHNQLPAMPFKFKIG